MGDMSSDEDEREDIAIAKLDQLIELVANIRTAWIASDESKHAREAAGRRLGPLEGDMSERESQIAVWCLRMSMSNEKRAEYDFCFQASGSEQFLFALVRQPSVLKGERLDMLLDDWAYIKNSREYKKAIEQRKARMEPKAKQKAKTFNKAWIAVHHQSRHLQHSWE